MNKTRNLLVDDSVLVSLRSGEMFELIDPGDWQGQEPPAREWTLQDWLPRRRAAYLTGDGGAGKSLLGQQLATAIAIGRPFLGIPTAQAPAIYLSAEDDYEEFQRRQHSICRSMDVAESELQMKLFLVSLFGQAENTMVDFDRDVGMRTLPAWDKLKCTAAVTLARFIVLDNVSHFFGGNEIDRGQVTAFANVLNSLAQQIDGTVLLIGHPNKQGDHYSGSTAFNNAFRARLFFDAPKQNGAHSDPDLRQLSLPKANYSRKTDPVEVRWHAGALIRDEDLPPSIAEEVRKVSAHTAANAAFLRCLDAATKQRRAVSHVPGVNYAPKIFAAMTEGKGTSEEAFRGAMERLVHKGEIAFEQRLWKGENYHWKVGIMRAEGHPPTPANPQTETAENREKPSANPVRQPSANPSEKSQKTVRQPPPANPLSPTGIKGEPPFGASPYPDPDELDWS